MFGRRRREPPEDTRGEPLTNTAVVEAMNNVAADDGPDARAMLFSLLLETRLLVVTPPGSEKPGARTVQAGESLDIVALSDEDGTVIPVFTSQESLSRWLTREAGYLGMPGRAVFEIAEANGTNKIAIDPGSPTSGYVTRYEIEQLARGRLPLGQAGDRITEETEVHIGVPATPPSPAALEALRTQLAQVPSVLRAWYFLMQQRDHPADLCIGIQYKAGVDPSGGIIRQIIDGAGEASEDVRSLAFLVADEHWQSTLANGAGELFYTRL